MKPLSASLEVPINQLLWLCEGLAAAYPDVKEYKRVVGIVRGVKKLAMANEPGLAFDAVEMAENYLADMFGSPNVAKRALPVKKALQRQIGESL